MDQIVDQVESNDSPGFENENTTKNITMILNSSHPHSKAKLSKKEKIPMAYEKSKRVITTTKSWKFADAELTYDFQTLIISKIKEQAIETENIHVIQFITRELRNKIYGYKCQDIKKNIYSEELFITIDSLIHKLVDCNLLCYYCRNPVYVLYEYVRASKQWTLERIDNARGHNIDNSEIACLSCNLSRRCMYHERYVFTKQMVIVKNSGTRTGQKDGDGGGTI